LHVGEQVPPQIKDEALADIAEEACVAVTDQTGDESDEEYRRARAVQDLHLREWRVVQPCVDQRHAAWFMRKHAIDHHFERPRTHDGERGVQNHGQKRK